MRSALACVMLLTIAMPAGAQPEVRYIIEAEVTSSLPSDEGEPPPHDPGELIEIEIVVDPSTRICGRGPLIHDPDRPNRVPPGPPPTALASVIRAHVSLDADGPGRQSFRLGSGQLIYMSKGSWAADASGATARVSVELKSGPLAADENDPVGVIPDSVGLTQVSVSTGSAEVGGRVLSIRSVHADGPADVAAPFGRLDGADFIQFERWFRAEDLRADITEPFGEVDLLDRVEYLERLAAATAAPHDEPREDPTP